jgi:hypothetical protein
LKSALELVLGLVVAAVLRQTGATEPPIRPPGDLQDLTPPVDVVGLEWLDDNHCVEFTLRDSMTTDFRFSDSRGVIRLGGRCGETSVDTTSALDSVRTSEVRALMQVYVDRHLDSAEQDSLLREMQSGAVQVRRWTETRRRAASVLHYLWQAGGAPGRKAAPRLPEG